MGRGSGSRGRGKGRGRGGGQSRGNERSDVTKSSTGTGDRWSAVPATNVRFETYYRAQGIIPDSEWPAFLAALHEPLPTTFRITGSRPIAPSLNKMIEDVYVPYLSGLEFEGIPLSPPTPLSWYPKGYAWQLNIAKQHIRKNEAFRKFQHFLVYETDSGNLSRQEAVSMLPPLLLDVQSHHLVLDMCAAPGSKSAQLLESLHLDENGPVSIPTGFLIANDSDAKRCHMLVHQSLHRIPAASMMVTNHDATQLPGLRLPIPPLAGADPTIKVPKWKAVQYDRILADVPCSGDGTMRKNLMIWRDWSPGNGSGLHTLQLRILMRGIALLKPGGRLVYSTCSMNPIENEAVVSAALALSPTMSLLPVPELLPSLIRRPGLTSWNIYDPNGETLPHPSLPVPTPPATIDPTASTSTSEDPVVSVEGEGEGEGVKVKKPKVEKVKATSQWPCGREVEFGMENCWRIYPHLQDTGGFFVAVLVKAELKEESVVEEVSAKREASASLEEPEAKRVAELSTSTEAIVSKVEVEAEEELPAVVEEEEIYLSTLPGDVAGPPPKKAGSGPQEFKEEPVHYLDSNDVEIQNVIDFFELNSSFPRESLLVRNSTGEAVRTMYLSSAIVKSVLTSNSHARMRVISCGVKVFSRQDNGKNDDTYPCKWRIMTEGLEIIRPFMGTKRIVKGSMSTLRKLISGVNILLGEFEEKEFLDRLGELEYGSCVLEILPGEETSPETIFATNLILPLWRSKVSVNLMVEKMDKSALSLRLYGSDITPNGKVNLTRKEKQAIAAAAVAESSTTTDMVVEEVVEEVAAAVEGEAL